MWVKSISFPHPTQRNSFHHTCVIACELIDANHECVKQLFTADLEKLAGEKHAFHAKQFGTTVNFHAKLIATIADQPTR